MIAQSRRKFIWFIIIGLFIFLPTDLFAQEETETPIVPTPIILPTITATVAPTSTSTSTSTATSTATATSTSTATSSPIPVEATIEMASDTPEPEVTNDASEPTLDVSNTEQVELTEILIPETPAEVTEVSSPVAQVEVTESVDPAPEQTEIILQPELEPELTAIVSEPFLTDTTEAWTVGDGWQLLPLDENYALQASGIAQATSYSQSTFSDVVVEALIQSQDMTIELHLRQSELDSYHLSLSPDGTVSIYKNDLVLASTMVTSNIPNQWRHIRFSAMGHTLRASIDNLEVLVTTDAQPLFEGDVSFSTTTSSENSFLLLDNLRIWIPISNTPNNIGSSTELPLQFSDVNIVSNINPNWDLLEQIDFEDAELGMLGWLSNGSETYVTGQQGMALRILGGDQTLEFILDDILNVAIEVEMLMEDGGAPLQMSGRKSEVGSYIVNLTPIGEVTLLRSETEMATITVPNFSNNTWYHVRLEIFHDTIRVFIDGNEVIAIQDNDPLPSGTISIGTDDVSSWMLLDNLEVWMPYDEIPWREGSSSTNSINPVSQVVNSVTSSVSSPIIYDAAGLVAAILSVENSFNNCPFDTLELGADIVLTTAAYEYSYGPSTRRYGLPRINYCIRRINGNGYTIERSSSATSFGIIIATRGLILDNVTIQGSELRPIGVPYTGVTYGGVAVVCSINCVLQNGTIIQNNNTFNYAAYEMTYGNLFIEEGTIFQNNTRGFRAFRGGEVLVAGTESNPVRFNNNGIGFDITETNAIISYVSMIDNVQAISLSGLSSGNNPIINIEQAFIYGHSSTGIYISRTSGPVTVNVTRSIVSNNTVGIDGKLNSLNISSSCIIGNQYGASLANAINNWWGDPLGPGNETGSTGDIVSSDVTYTPWITTKPALNLWGNICDSTVLPTPDSNPPGILISLPPLVFTNSFGGDSEIYKSQALSYTQLTDNTFEDTNPSYSSDGQQIAFQSLRNSDLGIYVMNDDGTNEILVASNNAIEPDWYPSNSDIVFARGSDLYRVNTSGTPIESQLTNHGTGEVHNPAISNDGNWIVYEQEGSLQVIDATCTVSCVSTVLLSGTAHSYPAWSPNGLQLAWSSNDDLYTASVNYVNSIPQLTAITELIEANSPQNDTNPSWTSDGQSIIFESNRDGPRSLYQYDLVSSASASSAQVQQFSVQASISGGAFPIIQQSGEPDGIAVAQAPTGLIIILEIEEVDNGTTVINGVERDIIDDRYDGQIPISGENDIVTSVTSGDLVTISVKAINSTSQVATNIQIQLDNVQPMDIIYQNINTPQGTTFDSNSGLWIISEINGTSDPTAPTEIELVIIAQVNSSLPLESYRVVTTELAQPINIQHLQQSSNLEERVVTVACEGWVNSNIFESNVRIAPRLFLDASGQESITTNDAIPNFTEVGVLEYVIAEDLFLLGEDDDNLSDEDEAKIPYAWFRITDRINGTNPANQFSRYIAAPVVSGCDELTYPFQFETYPLIATDLTATLPPPPQEISPIDINCTPFARELARNECATQVYVAFYQEFQNRNDGFPPTVRDLIAIFLSLELAPGDGLASEELLAATASNVYYGSCSSESNINPNGCDGYDVINFLQASDGWIQIGGTTINSTRLDELFNKLESNVINNSLPTTLNGYVTLDINGQTISPIAWGNYYYGTEGYNFFISNPSTSAHCEIIRSLEDGTFIDYVFVITGTTSNPATNYEAIGTPQWFDEYVNTGNEDLIPEPLATCSRETN